MISEGVDRLRRGADDERGSPRERTHMRNPLRRRKTVTSDPDHGPGRGSGPGATRGVTSDPDRGLAVNSGTDPQRPGTAARPLPETAPGTSGSEAPATDAFNAPHQPAAARREDVEGGGKGDPEDGL